MAEIFISYAREDNEFVHRLSRSLKQRKRDVWIDVEGIRPSADWRKETLEIIEAADAIVVVISPHSAASKTCADEIAHALKKSKRIIPVLYQDVDESTLSNEISGRQWIFLRDSDDFEEGVATLISALDTDLDWVRAHTRLLTRAIEWEKHNRDHSFALRGSGLRRAESLLTSKDGHEPRFVPLQVEYILTSRRTTNKRLIIASSAAVAAVLSILIFGLLFWEKRQENNFALAANFREMGISELGNNNPLAAELLFARALSISDNHRAREQLIEARAKSPRLLWISSPVKDGSLLAVSGDGTLFAAATGLEISIRSTERKQKIRVFRARTNSETPPVAAFGLKSNLFAMGSERKAEVWDLRSSSEQPIKVISTPSDISSLSINLDGSTIIVGGADGSISTWSIKASTFDLPKQFNGHSDKITSTAINSDGRILISGSWDETARVWDLQSGRSIQTFGSHDDALLCVAASPEGDLVASAGWDDTIWIWNRNTGNPVRALTGHKGSILSLAFSPDGKWLASGSEDRTARLWEVDKGRHVLTFPGHSGDVSSVAFLNFNGEQSVVTGDSTGAIRLWDLSVVGQRDELITLRGHQGAVTMVAFHPTAPLVASSSVDKSIQLWNLTTHKPVDAQKNQAANVAAVAFSSDGKYLASANKTSRVQIWSIETKEVQTFDDADSSAKIRHIAFSLDGQLVAGGSDDGKIRIWNIKEKKVIAAFAAHTAKVQGLEFTPDGKLLASSSEDSTVKLWEVGTWALQRTLIGHRSGVYEIAFSPDGRLVLTGSDDKTARLWDVVSGQEVIKPIEHISPVWAVGFSPDGKTIATGSEDSMVQLWELSSSKAVPQLANHMGLRISDGPVWWMRFSEGVDGTNLAVGSQDKIVRILNVSRLRSLFSNPAKLENEAEQQGGLMIGEGPTGEPQIVSLPQDRFDVMQPVAALTTALR